MKVFKSSLFRKKLFAKQIFLNNEYFNEVIIGLKTTKGFNFQR